MCPSFGFCLARADLFCYSLFIAFERFVHRDFAYLSIERQTDDGVDHDTDKEHLREQRRLDVEGKPAGKLLHHDLVDHLQQLVIHRQTDEQTQYDCHRRGRVVKSRDLPVAVAQDLDDGNGPASCVPAPL